MFSILLWVLAARMYTCQILLINTDLCVPLQFFDDVPRFDFLCG